MSLDDAAIVMRESSLHVADGHKSTMLHFIWAKEELFQRLRRTSSKRKFPWAWKPTTAISPQKFRSEAGLFSAGDRFLKDTRLSSRRRVKNSRASRIELRAWA